MGLSKDWTNFVGTPITPETGKAEELQIWLENSWCPSEQKSPLKFWRKGSVSISRDCSNFLGTPNWVLSPGRHSSSWYEIGWYFDARGSTYKNCTRWQIICRRRPSYLEQSATQHAWLDTIGGNICNTVKNLPVCFKAAALVFLN